MFRAVREALNRAREKNLLGLFAFEFTVVLLGVLAAQGLQNWSRERELRTETLAAKARLERGFADSRGIVDVWNAALPCLRARVGAIMRTAATGETLAPGFAGRPFLPAADDYSESAETYARLTELLGNDVVMRLREMPERIGIIDTVSGEISARWEVFRLLDPQYGPVSLADRSAARLAGAEILSHFRRIDASILMMTKLSERLAPAVRTPFDPAMNILPVRSCEELWAKGTAYRMLEPWEVPPR